LIVFDRVQSCPIVVVIIWDFGSGGDSKVEQ
jgi:hypothetical protein